MNTLFYPLFTLLFIAFAACTNETSSDSEQSNTDTDKDTLSETDSSNSDENEVVEPSLTYGIDISKWQGDEMELLKKENDSLSFVISRSTLGITYTDPDFKNNWKLSKEKGFIRGAYHFYMSDDAPGPQSANFVNAIKEMDDNDLSPIVDFEEKSIIPGSDKEKVLADLMTFIQMVETKTGRTPIIYTDINIGSSYLTDEKFAKYPLWVADYNPGTEPRMPGAWKGTKWVLWQKTDQYMVDNIKNDFDCFNGSLADLKAFIASSILK
ncbi:MAG: GH25 family lysozyme [Crocinitomicaceae bacterium]|nr:GH25 family lysozyme [Crocinitomicaceae bacterium]